MPSRRAISLSLLATKVGQSKRASGMVQPNTAASSISCWTWEPITNSFLGTQPRITQVPPIRYSSATMTRAPWPAAIRAARTPPEPPPMTNRSTSNSAIYYLDLIAKQRSDLLAPLAHFGAELAIDDLGEVLGPAVHIGHAELDCPGLAGEQLLAQRRLVEGDQVDQLLLGELVAV